MLEVQYLISTQHTDGEVPYLLFVKLQSLFVLDVSVTFVLYLLDLFIMLLRAPPVYERTERLGDIEFKVWFDSCSIGIGFVGLVDVLFY